MKHKNYNKNNKIDYKLYGTWIVLLGVMLFLVILL